MKGTPNGGSGYCKTMRTCAFFQKNVDLGCHVAVFSYLQVEWITTHGLN